MRRRARSALFATPILLAFLGAATAQAGTLTSATWVTQIAVPGGLTVTLPLTTQSTGTSTATSVDIFMLLNGTLTQFDFPDHRVLVSIFGSGKLTATPSMVEVDFPITVPLIAQGAQITTLGTIGKQLFAARFAFGVGSYSRTYAGITFLGVPHYITQDFYGWTLHTKAFTGLTTKLAPLPDVVVKGSFDLTAKGGGTVTLVSPSKITVVSTLNHKKTVNFSTLKLFFVPEPETWLLLAATGLGLLVIRKR